MKKLLFTLITVLMTTLAVQADVTINSSNFPDANFRSYLLSLYPSGTITTSQINSLTAAHITTASQKYWVPKAYNGSAWVNATASATRDDVNGDGNVNVSDAIMLINYVLNGSASGINLGAADCNEDGSINISDAIKLINYVLNGTW